MPNRNQVNLKFTWPEVVPMRRLSSLCGLTLEEVNQYHHFYGIYHFINMQKK